MINRTEIKSASLTQKLSKSYARMVENDIQLCTDQLFCDYDWQDDGPWVKLLHFFIVSFFFFFFGV